MAIAGFEDEFTTYVATAAGLTEGVRVFRGELPERDDGAADVTVVRFLGGRPSPGDEQRFRPTVQILTRAADPATARATNGGLHDVLHSGASGMHRIGLTSFVCMAVQASQMPFRVGVDAQGRASWAFTLKMEAYPV